MIIKEIPLHESSPQDSRAAKVYFDQLTYQEGALEEEKRAVEYLKYIAGLAQDGENYLDHGGSGRVFSFPHHKDTCFKVMRNRHKQADSFKYDLGVSPSAEFSFMERLRDLNHLGCRIPVPEMCIESGDTSIIVMERFNAFNLQHILNGKEELPEGFDYDVFADVLQEYIEQLHKNKKIAHGDLFPRNIMIDKETGLPYVIDFGRAKNLVQVSPEIAQVYMEKDWEKFDDIFIELEKLRNNEQVLYEDLPVSEKVYTFGSSVKVHYSKAVLKQALSLINEKDFDISKDVTVKLGESYDLILTNDKDSVRGFKEIKKGDQIFFLGRKKKDYSVG